MSTVDVAGLLMGTVDFEGITREVCLAYVPDARIGDYVIVHVGFALNVLDEAEARRTLELLRSLGGAWQDELGPETEPARRPDLAPGPEPAPVPSPEAAGTHRPTRPPWNRRRSASPR